PEVELEIDGGVDATTAAYCLEAGAEVLVAGSAVFGKNDRAAAIQAIKNSKITKE
ncbi:MAG: ribulose-phosphate 3-epimerase, partial [Clostridia bacterium]|nr:ribulose-phosphate 3-epimerase [Clostridia bacterium]